MARAIRIKRHMAVVGPNDGLIARVDHLEGDVVKLTKDASGVHHYIPLNWVDFVDDKVHVNRPPDEVRRDWSTKAPAREGERAGHRPHAPRTKLGRA